MGWALEVRYSDLVEILEAEIGHDLALRACEALCRAAAGESLYIPRRAERPVILPTDTPKSVQQRYGVSRATSHNWVNRWR